MSKASTRTRPVKISSRTRELYEKRDRSLDHADVPQLPPAQWAQGMIGKYYRPLKSQISFRIDNDVLAWLKAKRQGHLSRINAILRERMENERRSARWGDVRHRASWTFLVSGPITPFAGELSTTRLDAATGAIRENTVDSAAVVGDVPADHRAGADECADFP